MRFSFLAHFTFFLIVCLAGGACAIKPQNQEAQGYEEAIQMRQIEKEAKALLGEDVTLHPSPDQSIVVACLYVKDRDNAVTGTLRAAVYSILTGKLISQKTVPNCSDYGWNKKIFVAQELVGIQQKNVVKKPKEHIIYLPMMGK
ncbi:MAG: hypothetical protein KTR24_09115 [Saprospiraceae bacterium]|nr:hypothetical protein [Saprospiraceae bacterium]